MPTLDYFDGPPPPRHNKHGQWGCLVPGVGMVILGVVGTVASHRGNQYSADPGGWMCMATMGFVLTGFIAGMMLLAKMARGGRETTAEDDEDEDDADVPPGFSRR